MRMIVTGGLGFIGSHLCEALLKFEDYVNPSDLSMYYNAADVFVFPSYYEGFGQPPLEALACGTPTITTNCASISEVVNDAAMMIKNPFDYHELAYYIEKLLLDDWLQSDLIEKGFIQAKKFSWDKYADGVKLVYDKVLNE